MSKRRNVLQPGIWFSFVLFGLLMIVAACGGSSPTTNTGSTPTAIVSNSSSPTSGAGNTPVSSSPTT
ncbi:MAG TPA: hypothetical protein VKU38_23525, partial [Ktedonobacteraceae bacterium]|nr:hypothetical protein [Ktedonobacteraceae bacterium]